MCSHVFGISMHSLTELLLLRWGNWDSRVYTTDQEESSLGEGDSIDSDLTQHPLCIAFQISLTRPRQYKTYQSVKTPTLLWFVTKALDFWSTVTQEKAKFWEQWLYSVLSTRQCKGDALRSHVVSDPLYCRCASTQALGWYHLRRKHDAKVWMRMGP